MTKDFYNKIYKPWFDRASGTVDQNSDTDKTADHGSQLTQTGSPLSLLLLASLILLALGSGLWVYKYRKPHKD